MAEQIDGLVSATLERPPVEVPTFEEARMGKTKPGPPVTVTIVVTFDSPAWEALDELMTSLGVEW